MHLEDLFSCRDMHGTRWDLDRYQWWESKVRIDMQSIVFSICASSIPCVDANSCISIPRKRHLRRENVGTSGTQVDEGDEDILMVVPCRSTYNLWWLVVRLITHDPPGDRVHLASGGTPSASMKVSRVEMRLQHPRKMSKLHDTRREAGGRGSTQRFLIINWKPPRPASQGTREPKMAKLRTN